MAAENIHEAVAEVVKRSLQGNSDLEDLIEERLTVILSPAFKSGHQ